MASALNGVFGSIGNCLITCFDRAKTEIIDNPVISTLSILAILGVSLQIISNYDRISNLEDKNIQDLTKFKTSAKEYEPLYWTKK